MLTSTAVWRAAVMMMRSWAITVRLSSTNARPARVRTMVNALTNRTRMNVIVLDISAMIVNIGKAGVNPTGVNMEAHVIIILE